MYSGKSKKINTKRQLESELSDSYNSNVLEAISLIIKHF